MTLLVQARDTVVLRLGSIGTGLRLNPPGTCSYLWNRCWGSVPLRAGRFSLLRWLAGEAFSHFQPQRALGRLHIEKAFDRGDY